MRRLQAERHLLRGVTRQVIAILSPPRLLDLIVMSQDDRWSKANDTRTTPVAMK